jgi:hypothetical protein
MASLAEIGFLIGKGTNKHVHIVKYSKVLN